MQGCFHHWAVCLSFQSPQRSPGGLCLEPRVMWGLTLARGPDHTQAAGQDHRLWPLPHSGGHAEWPLPDNEATGHFWGTFPAWDPFGSQSGLLRARRSWQPFQEESGLWEQWPWQLSGQRSKGQSGCLEVSATGMPWPEGIKLQIPWRTTQQGVAGARPRMLHCHLGILELINSQA